MLCQVFSVFQFFSFFNGITLTMRLSNATIQINAGCKPLNGYIVLFLQQR